MTESCWSATALQGERRRAPGVLLLVLDGWPVAKRGVQSDGVEPGDVLDDGELELRARAPDAIGDQLVLAGISYTR